MWTPSAAVPWALSMLCTEVCHDVWPVYAGAVTLDPVGIVTGRGSYNLQQTPPKAQF